MPPTRRLISLPTTESESLSEEFTKEALKWVAQNKGLALDPDAGHYTSPRISSEIMDCSMPMTFDHYNVCSLGCAYCFAFFFKSNNPATKDLTLKTVNMRSLINAISGQPTDSRGRMFHKHFYSKKFLLHWGGMADPFCNFERTNKTGLPLLRTLGELNYPTLFSFKGNTILTEEYFRIFQDFSAQKNFAFQVSMVTADPKMAAKVEVGVPSPAQRLKAIKALSDLGYWTILRLRPFIIGVTDESLDDLLNMALEAGISAISTEFFALDARANVGMKTRYDWLAKIIGTDNLMKYFKDLSPRERGGYMRLNRLVKEPYIRKIYQFCAENGLVLGVSDPDFKELNTSGSCCGMPDAYPDNPLLCNWTRNQLTYHLKQMRLSYHKPIHLGIEEVLHAGQALKFSDVFPDDVSYLDDTELTNDHVSVSSMCNAERYAHTYRSILRAHWNNMRSPANPRNYFHGKLMPVGVDEQGDLVYRYNPSEYEKRWMNEGMDLTK